jgi:putative phosphoribosyl transferase
MWIVDALHRQARLFADRAEAGKLLGRRLENRRGRVDVVLGIPRGGMIVAREIARALRAELDVIFAHKLGAPGNPELAVGAVTEDGRVFRDERLFSALGLTDEWVKAESVRTLGQTADRAATYRRIRPKVPLGGKVVVVADDGVATGSTMQAALCAVREEQPRELIAALPVGPRETVARLARYCDEVVCIYTPSHFEAVGQFYLRFDQTDDRDIMEMLGETTRTGGSE